MLGYRYGAFQPRRVPEIEQHLRTGGQALRGELEGLARTFAVESASLFESVNIFHQRVRVAEISDVIVEGIVEPLGALHKTGKISFPKIRGHVDAFKLPVDMMLSSVFIGVGGGASVVLEGGGQRWRSVGDVVAEPSRIKDDRLLYRGGRLMRGAQLAVF